jgi:hypothetical protein
MKPASGAARESTASLSEAWSSWSPVALLTGDCAPASRYCNAEGAVSRERKLERTRGLAALGHIKGQQGDMRGAASTLKKAAEDAIERGIEVARAAGSNADLAFGLAVRG